ncbi:MAG: sensory signal transduction histidine kinase domain protein, partial [Burkholderiales bacterium]|nr:sensory signal transduction histidine kinase domain protein [Burkholderiales bacterium]
ERTGEAQIRKATGVVVHAIVKWNPLPDPIGGKVFTFEDVEDFKRLEDLGFLGQVATEIATQVQTPLMLASSWTQRIGKLAAEPGNDKQIAELAHRTQAQLRRIQSCLDRIAVYRSIDQIKATLIPIDLESELERVVTELPESDRDRIQFKHPGSGVQVNADPGHVSFVFDTLLAYFLRDLPNSQKIRVSTGHHQTGGWFDCKVNWPSEESAESIADAAALPMLLELDLVKTGLQKILKKYGGSLTLSPPAGRRVSQVRVELPLS